LNPPHFFVFGEGWCTGLGKARGGNLNLEEEVLFGEDVNLLDAVLRGEDGGVERDRKVRGDA
jgi:hypothetical protein